MICKDCGARVTEYRCQYCSECGYIRRAIALDIYRHDYRNKYPDRVRADWETQNARPERKEYKKKWKAAKREARQ